ncbi:hypothetical protein ELG63_36305 [Rhizobium leguminosarum]|uniref:hypothetical protein n=1 Tax=Rhizobium leguminosarum TaxID=384 RepID=UPI001031057A|nr:hypothetical protein [Rhizobium leguminosarum]TBH28152.1 hypothetical protein ELG63_36305 [Rhizobium leguminosarum]
MLNLLKRKPATEITVAYNGVKFPLELDMPIISSKLSAMIAAHGDLRLSSHRNGKLSPEKLVLDCKARLAQIKAYRDAEEVAPFSGSRSEMDRTAKVLKMKLDSLAGGEPIVFVGDSTNFNLADFAIKAALDVASNADAAYAHQVKALLQIGLKAAESELLAARDHILTLVPDFLFNEQTVVIEIEANKPTPVSRVAVLTDGRDGRD